MKTPPDSSFFALSYEIKKNNINPIGKKMANYLPAAKNGKIHGV